MQQNQTKNIQIKYKNQKNKLKIYNKILIKQKRNWRKRKTNIKNIIRIKINKQKINKNRSRS